MKKPVGRFDVTDVVTAFERYANAARTDARNPSGRLMGRLDLTRVRVFGLSPRPRQPLHHSSRNAVAGSTRIARHAGATLAATAVSAATIGTTTPSRPGQIAKIFYVLEIARSC